MLRMEIDLTNIGPIRTTYAELSDIDGMVHCHIAAFPGQFMTEMGPRWLKGLYSYFIQHNGGICLVAVDRTGKVLRFAVGGDPTIRDEFLRKAVFRYPHILFWKFLTVSIVRRKLLAELFRKLRIGRRTSTSTPLVPQTTNVTRSGDLVSIGVFPQCQGSGIAGQIIEEFRQAGVRRGYDVLRLSVRTDNSRAVAFYKKHGWIEAARDRSGVRFELGLRGK